MLYAFFGTDTVGVREKAHEQVSKLEEEGASVVRMTAEEFSPGGVEDAAGSTSLFGERHAYILDTPSESKEFFDHTFDNLDLFAESGNTFVLIEGPLLAPQKKKLEKHAETAVEVTAEKRERFNVFAMADALLRKDKKSLWLLLVEARRHGASEEEVVGILLWQVKLLRLAARTKSAKEAGQKDFPYNKAKRALSKFQDGEPDDLSRELLSIYHDGHLGQRDLDLALERFVLTL